VIPTDGSSAYGFGMTTPVRDRHRALLPSLVLAAALAAAVAIAGWLLLLFVKGTVVLITYALGIALVLVPLLLAHRIVAGHTGSERWRRIGTVAQVVALGAALCLIAHLVGGHGWLLIAVPAAVVAVTRGIQAVGTHRRVAVH
jgi:phosphatidylserine synthase